VLKQDVFQLYCLSSVKHFGLFGLHSCFKSVLWIKLSWGDSNTFDCFHFTCCSSWARLQPPPWPYIGLSGYRKWMDGRTSPIALDESLGWLSFWEVNLRPSSSSLTNWSRFTSRRNFVYLKTPQLHDSATTMLHCGDGVLQVMSGVVFAPSSFCHIVS